MSILIDILVLSLGYLNNYTYFLSSLFPIYSHIPLITYSSLLCVIPHLFHLLFSNSSYSYLNPYRNNKNPFLCYNYNSKNHQYTYHYQYTRLIPFVTFYPDPLCYQLSIPKTVPLASRISYNPILGLLCNNYLTNIYLSYVRIIINMFT